MLEIPLEKLLTEGFNTGHGYIRPPKRPASATALAAIILQSSQNDMFGGQSFPFFDKQMAPFIDGIDEDEVYQAMEALVYNLNSMHSRAGSQVPFSSINLGTDTSEEGRRVTRNFLLAYEAGLGRGENPIFPNVIFRVKKGVNFEPQDPNYDLFQLAVRVASKRLNPTFSFMDSSFNKEYDDQVAYMGCRTRVMANRRGPAVTTGRGNLSFTTINLPRLGIRAERNMKTFYRLLDEVTELAINQLYHRFKIQCRLRVKDMPFVMGQGLYMGSEGLKPDDSIEPAIVNGTLSVGFIGLAEMLVALTGYHHGQSQESQQLGLEIVNYLRKKTDEACERFNLNYTLLATPAEGLSGRFVKIDRKEYGIIPGVTNQEYYTNSCHIPVHFPISSFDKISLEGPYHKYLQRRAHQLRGVCLAAAAQPGGGGGHRPAYGGERHGLRRYQLPGGLLLQLQPAGGHQRPELPALRLCRHPAHPAHHRLPEHHRPLQRRQGGGVEAPAAAQLRAAKPYLMSKREEVTLPE